MDLTNGAFKRRENPFSQVSNEALRSKTLSMKAKGLYGMIQSYITVPNFTLYKWFLLENSIEGEKAFDSAWKELKEEGYLKQYRIRDKSQNKFIYQYELLETADKETPSLINVGIDGSIVENNENIVPTQNGGSTNDEIEPLQNGGGTKHTGLKTGAYNNNIINNTLVNNNLSIYQEEIKNKSIETIDNKINEEIIKEREFYKEIIKDNIEYDCFENKEDIGPILDIITDTVCCSSKTIRIGKEDKPKEIVKNQFLKLKNEHIEYVEQSLKQNTTKIKNIKNYIQTCLYNAPLTIEKYYQAKVNNDLYGEGE